jgi:hypothetical protein
MDTSVTSFPVAPPPEKEDLSPAVKQLVIEYEQLCELIKYRQKNAGMEFYIPNAIQYRAHRSTARVIAIVKGNRMGGSTWGAMELAYHLTKKYPAWYPEERKFKGPIKVRVVTDKFFKIESVIEQKLKQYLPKDEWVRVRRSPQGYMTKMITKDGSTIEFLTGEQDLMAFEGQDLDLFWGDEPIDRRKYVATQRGLVDRSGRTLLTFTPLIEPWMKDEIVDKADGRKIDIFYGTTRDNLCDIEGNKILNEQDIKDFEDIMTEEERETRISGKFFHLKGVVYKELNPSVHFINNFTYETGYPVICVLDPHDRLPHWVIWAMIDRIDDVYVMYEYIKEGTVAQLAASIKAIEGHFGWNVVKRLIDPNFGRKPLISTGLSVIEELRKYRVSFAEANDADEAGRLKVKEYLHYNKDKPLDINNKPKLFFVQTNTPQTCRSMQNFQYDEWQSNVERDPKEKVKPKDSHGADCVRYLCASRVSFRQPAIYQLQETPY